MCFARGKANYLMPFSEFLFDRQYYWENKGQYINFYGNCYFDVSKGQKKTNKEIISQNKLINALVLNSGNRQMLMTPNRDILNYLEAFM